MDVTTPKRKTPPLRFASAPPKVQRRIPALGSELFRTEACLNAPGLDHGALAESITHELLAAKNRSFNDGVKHGMWLMETRVRELQNVIDGLTYSNI